MWEATKTWWDGLKWYYKWPALVLLILVGVLAVFVKIASTCSAGGGGQKQVRALDDLHEKQVDATLVEQEKRVEVSEAETVKHDAELKERVDELIAIKKEAVKLDEELEGNWAMTIEELDAWRKKHGV